MVVGHPDHVIGAEAVGGSFGLRPPIYRLDQAVINRTMVIVATDMAFRKSNDGSSKTRHEIISVNILLMQELDRFSAIREHQVRMGWF